MVVDGWWMAVILLLRFTCSFFWGIPVPLAILFRLLVLQRTTTVAPSLIELEFCSCQSKHIVVFLLRRRTCSSFKALCCGPHDTSHARQRKISKNITAPRSACHSHSHSHSPPLANTTFNLSKGLLRSRHGTLPANPSPSSTRSGRVTSIPLS